MISHAESRDSGGRVIAGKYKLIELIGSGSMGVVWRAEHFTLGASVALKLLHMKHVGRANAADLTKRFLREARAAVRGPHVAQILDHGIDAPTPRPSRPEVPRLYDSVIDLEEITHFWEGASRAANQDAEKRLEHDE